MTALRIAVLSQNICEHYKYISARKFARILLYGECTISQTFVHLSGPPGGRDNIDEYSYICRNHNASVALATINDRVLSACARAPEKTLEHLKLIRRPGSQPQEAYKENDDIENEKNTRSRKQVDRPHLLTPADAPETVGKPSLWW